MVIAISTPILLVFTNLFTVRLAMFQLPSALARLAKVAQSKARIPSVKKAQCRWQRKIAVRAYF